MCTDMLALEIVDEEKRILTMKEIMNDLPQAHRDVLQFTIFHLARYVTLYHVVVRFLPMQLIDKIS
jgi:hypothetical protein